MLLTIAIFCSVVAVVLILGMEKPRDGTFFCFSLLFFCFAILLSVNHGYVLGGDGLVRTPNQLDSGKLYRVAGIYATAAGNFVAVDSGRNVRGDGNVKVFVLVKEIVPDGTLWVMRSGSGYSAKLVPVAPLDVASGDKHR